MTVDELEQLLARVARAEDRADELAADLVLEALAPAELDALGELERRARWN